MVLVRFAVASNVLSSGTRTRPARSVARNVSMPRASPTACGWTALTPVHKSSILSLCMFLSVWEVMMDICVVLLTLVGLVGIGLVAFGVSDIWKKE